MDLSLDRATVRMLLLPSQSTLVLNHVLIRNFGIASMTHGFAPRTICGDRIILTDKYYFKWTAISMNNGIVSIKHWFERACWLPSIYKWTVVEQSCEMGYFVWSPAIYNFLFLFFNLSHKQNRARCDIFESDIFSSIRLPSECYCYHPNQHSC